MTRLANALRVAFVAGLLGLSGFACQPPMPATPCGGDPDCPPGARCDILLGVCAVEDAAMREDGATTTDR